MADEKINNNGTADDVNKVIKTMIEAQSQFIADLKKLVVEFKNISSDLETTNKDIQKDSKTTIKSISTSNKDLNAQLKQMVRSSNEQIETIHRWSDNIADFNPFGLLDITSWGENLKKAAGKASRGYSTTMEKRNADIDEKIPELSDALKKEQTKLSKMDENDPAYAAQKALVNTKQQEIEDLQKQKQQNTINAKTFNAKANLIGNIFSRLGKTINNVFEALGIDIKSIFSGLASTMRSTLENAAKFSSNSLFGNSEQRNLRMKYGLSASGGYAMSNTMSMLGMNESDLMYMNDTQKEYFAELSSKYQSWYEQMEATGVFKNVQEAQLEFKMFKQEIAMKFLTWFAAHKDQIMKMIEGLFTFMEGVFNFISMIVDGLSWLFGGSSSSAASTAETLDTSQTSDNSSKTYNIEVSNENNISTIASAKDIQSATDSGLSSAIKALSNYVTTRG